MNIIPAPTCPQWCDPRTHVEHWTPTSQVETCEHRTPGLTWKPASADVDITLCTSRLDNREPVVGHTGDINVLLLLEDTASRHPDGGTISIEMDLDPIDAEMFAAALVVEAAKVRALRSRPAGSW